MSKSSTRLNGALQGWPGFVLLFATFLPGLLSACGGTSNGTTSAAQADSWQRAASVAITPMAQRIPTMAQQASQWEQGTLDAATYRPELATTLAVMTAAHDQVAKLPPYPGQPMVDRLYLASMTLYVDSAKADQASLDLDPALRRQVALLAERVRELGDRVFDQGRLLTGQSLVPAGLSGAKVQLPLAVPDWTAEGLAPGPPLEPGPAASVERPAPLPAGGPQVRLRLAELVQQEAALASVASGLAGGPDGDMLRALSAGLGGAGRLVG